MRETRHWLTITTKMLRSDKTNKKKKRSLSWSRNRRVQRNHKALFLRSSLSVKVIACVSLRRSSKFESEMRLFTDSINCDDKAISWRTQRYTSDGVVEQRAFAVHQSAPIRVSKELPLKVNLTGNIRVGQRLFMPDERNAFFAVFLS